MGKSPLLIYIHGFNSSSLSHKANVMRAFCEQSRPDIKLISPSLPSFPQEAAEMLAEIVESHIDEFNIGLVGSSLGGYLAIWLNSRYSLKAVVVNPAIKPYELLVDYLGPQQNPYTGHRYILEPHHIDELKALDTAFLKTPEDFWLLQQMGDEILNYRQAVSYFVNSKQNVEQGGDHSFINFERYPAKIIDFLQL